MAAMQWHWCVTLTVVVLGALAVPNVGLGTEDSGNLFSGSSHFSDTVKQDYKDLYLSPDRLLQLGAGFGIGAVVANTSADREIQNWYQERIRTDGGDRVSKVAKTFGEGLYMIPVCVSAALWGDRFGSDAGTSPIGTWGQRATRAYLTATPLLLLAQWGTGGSRPTESGSHWRPFHDNNGVSGHAFIGAVPFLTAARMCEDNHVARYLLYACSVLPALSRVNDNAHYPSQAFLGWFLAWEATDAIAQGENSNRHVSLAPMTTGDGWGLGLRIQW